MATQTVSTSGAGTFSLGGELTVNRLGFGAMRITGDGILGPPKNHAGALAVLRRAVELGVNFIDTADSYGPNVSEELIAEALAPYPKGLVVTTKGGWTRPGPGYWSHDASPEHLRKAVDGSLKRLRLERIELYQLHVPAPLTPFDKSVGALKQLHKPGQDPADWALQCDQGARGAGGRYCAHRLGSEPLQLCRPRVGERAGILRTAQDCVYTVGAAGTG